MSPRSSAARSAGVGEPFRALSAPAAPAQSMVLISEARLAELVRDAVLEALAEQRSDVSPERLAVGPVEMSRMIDVSRTTLHRMRRAGCPAIKCGDIFKFEPASVLAWLKNRGGPAGE